MLGWLEVSAASNADAPAAPRNPRLEKLINQPDSIRADEEAHKKRNPAPIFYVYSSVPLTVALTSYRGDFLT
jgi:hypothetical protein